MPRRQILTPAEYTTFETPLALTNIQRQRFFNLSQSLLDLLSTFRTPTNQIGFVLTLGYFLATKRFFAKSEGKAYTFRQFHEVDAALEPLKAIEAIAFSSELSDTEKVQSIQKVLTNGNPQRHEALEQLTVIKTQAQREAEDADYYEVLAKQSRKLHNRLAEMVKLLTFSGDETSDLMTAIGH